MKYFKIYLIINCVLFSQLSNNYSFNNKITSEWKTFNSKNDLKYSSGLSVNYNNHIYINSNLPNLENNNGLYFPKGVYLINSAYIKYDLKHLSLFAEPTIYNRKSFSNSDKKIKEREFSVLNDVNIDKIYSLNNFRNLGIEMNYDGFYIGYSNSNIWWGPGMHNSLTISNNSEGFFHYYVENKKYKRLSNNIKYKIKYLVTDAIKNRNAVNYYLSGISFITKYQNIEFGISKNIISGGDENFNWKQRNAMSVLFSREKEIFWDTINSYFIKMNLKKSGLIAFIEWGYPKRNFGSENNRIYYDHARGTNFGLRKFGVFGNDKIVYGIEYLNLSQSSYYNMLPSPNWYDNIKYEYSSYKGRRWGSHSGTDSDDLLFYIGYVDNSISFNYGINFERHGITYHFPPEVKIENRISASYSYNNLYLELSYEDEYYEHYAFVDVNQNVWQETFELGSKQLTQTLFFSVTYKLF